MIAETPTDGSSNPPVPELERRLVRVPEDDGRPFQLIVGSRSS